MNTENQIALSSMSNQLLFYGSDLSAGIEYISDIHIDHYAKFYDGDVHQAIKSIAQQLYESKKDGFYIEKITAFLGDIATDPEIVIEFYPKSRLL